MSSTSRTQYRGGMASVSPAWAARPLVRARGPGVPGRKATDLPSQHPGLQTGFEPAAETATDSGRGPRRFQGWAVRSLTDAEVAALATENWSKIIPAIAGKRLTVDQVRRLLPAFPETRGITLPASSVPSALNRFQAFELLAVHTEASREELSALSDAFSPAGERGFGLILDRLPPPSTRLAVHEGPFAKLLGEVFGPASVDDPGEILARTLRGHTFDSVQLRLLLMRHRNFGLAGLRQLWPRWRGGDVDLLVNSSWLLEDEPRARRLLESAPSAEERARLKDPAHLAHRAALLERRFDDRHHVELLVPRDGRQLSGLQIWELATLNPQFGVYVMTTLARCWDGTLRPSVLLRAVEGPDRYAVENFMEAFRLRKVELSRGGQD